MDLSVQSVSAEGIDYLSIEGIELEPKTEIAMIATDSSNIFYDIVKRGGVKKFSDQKSRMRYRRILRRLIYLQSWQ